MGSLCGGPHDH
jgi:hypothetical protein